MRKNHDRNHHWFDSSIVPSSNMEREGVYGLYCNPPPGGDLTAIICGDVLNINLLQNLISKTKSKHCSDFYDVMLPFYRLKTCHPLMIETKWVHVWFCVADRDSVKFLHIYIQLSPNRRRSEFNPRKLQGPDWWMLIRECGTRLQHLVCYFNLETQLDSGF